MKVKTAEFMMVVQRRRKVYKAEEKCREVCAALSRQTMNEVVELSPKRYDFFFFFCDLHVTLVSKVSLHKMSVLNREWCLLYSGKL